MTDISQGAALRDEVRDRYARAARAVQTVLERGEPVPSTSACCGTTTDSCCGATAAEPCCEPVTGAVLVDESDAGRFGATLYSTTEAAALPEAALLASLGCGNPTAVADLREGETVLDLGSGGGIDVLLSAARVGPTGRAYGLDMTDEMLELALRNQAEAGATNVQFLKGHIEAIPLPAATVDVIISNCVINLSTDKPAVFAEMARVVRAGGRIGISDVVADDALTPEQRAERGSYVGCIAGALTFSEYEQGLRAVGFEQVSVTPTHQVADGMHSAIVKAVRGAASPISAARREPGGRSLEVVDAGCC
jgi:arsenite methyltransferase